jgi:site-specific DNA recombinase
MTKSTCKIKQQTSQKKAAIYARVSSQKQKDEETIDSQVDALYLYACENGYTINDKLVFLDNGVSGSILQRPALDELRDMIRFEPIETLLVYAPDRLSRNYTYQLILMEEFKKNGVKVCFLKNPPSDNTPEAKMFQHFQGIFAEYERALILDRSRRGRIYKAKQGDPAIIPSVPYGYRKIKQEKQTMVEIVKEEAEVVKKIFQLYLHESQSLMEVARTVSSTGIKPRKGGKQWDRTTIRDILKNPTYIGTSYFGKTERSDGSSDRIRKYASKVYLKPKYARKKRPQNEWVAISVPPIISESDFEQVQVQLKKNKELASRNTKYPSLLQGLVTCGLCGQPFYKRVRKNGERSIGYYYCRGQVDKKLKKCSNKAVHQEEIDKLVYEEVFKLLKNPNLVQQELHRRAKESPNTEELVQREILLKKELFKLSQESDRLLDAYQSGVVELKELKRRNQELDIRRKSIDNDIKGMQALRIENENGLEFGELFENILKRMQLKVSILTFEEKRKLVRLLVEQVVIHTETIEITHCVSPMAISQQECQLWGDSRS